MQGIALPPMDRRLQGRYGVLVQSHMRSAPQLAAGVASLPGTGSSFAATQAAWRFLNNERVSLGKLVEPLRDVGRQRAAVSKSDFVLLVHDWSKLSFGHQSKRDLVQLTHETDVGYELTTALLVDADDGKPLAPMEVHFKTATGIHSTREPAPADEHHLDQVLPTMQASGTWGLGKPLVHVLDREADSVDRYRDWDAAGHKFLVRADDRRVKWAEGSALLTEIGRSLEQRREFRKVGQAEYRGAKARLWVVETAVVLDRPARKSVKGCKFQRPGRPLNCRFIIAQVRDEAGKVLAQWFLLSNVPNEWATPEQLARCYYWRWRIESFFKLLKSHGQQIEQWQQETGLAIARRLLVAAMACVVVWQLQADDAPVALEFKNVLIRLSGRQTKRAKPHSAPALLAGLGVMLSMLNLLEAYDPQELKRMAQTLLGIDTG